MLDPRVTPWHEQPHTAQIAQVAIPRAVEKELRRAVREEERQRGKFSASAAVREALQLWLARRAG